MQYYRTHEFKSTVIREECETNTKAEISKIQGCAVIMKNAC